MAGVSVHALGSLQIKLDGKLASGFDSDKVRALLVYLMMEDGRPHRRQAPWCHLSSGCRWGCVDITPEEEVNGKNDEGAKDLKPTSNNKQASVKKAETIRIKAKHLDQLLDEARPEGERFDPHTDHFVTWGWNHPDANSLDHVEMNGRQQQPDGHARVGETHRFRVINISRIERNATCAASTLMHRPCRP